MKKLTAFVLSAMMVLSLAACGAKTETPADTITTAAQEAMECTNAYCNNAQVVVTK